MFDNSALASDECSKRLPAAGVATFTTTYDWSASSARASGIFTDGAGLKEAVGEWKPTRRVQAAHGPIAGWDVSRVDNFDCEWVVDPVGLAECVDNVGMFSSNFNGDVSNWDTSSATTMTGTFWNAAAFNRPLAWDTSKLTTMESTFRGTSGAFNPELPYCSDYCNGNVVENDYLAAILPAVALLATNPNARNAAVAQPTMTITRHPATLRAARRRIQFARLMQRGLCRRMHSRSRPARLGYKQGDDYALHVS